MIGVRSSPRREWLPPEASTARRARQIVTEVLEAAGLDEHVEVATLLVSETVTNALLHAATELELFVGVAGSQVRVEVWDGSPVLPGVRHYDDEATTGRGVGLVELLAASWGVEPGAAGKAVWFTLGEAREDGPGYGVPDEEVVGDGFTVRFVGMPVQLVRSTLQYGDAVLREVALAALSGQIAPDLPAWRGSGIDLAPVLDPIESAVRSGDGSVDLEATFPVGAADGAQARLDLVEHADRLAVAGRLLSVAALPEISECRRWLLGEIVAQGAGADPSPWAAGDHVDSPRSQGELSAGDLADLSALAGPLVVADDQNRILHVDDAAGALLGWEPGDLVGRRLITIVPPKLRDAHVAGYVRHQLTGASVLLGRVVQVPALRRDGTTVEVALHIERYRSAAGCVGFLATLTPV